MNAGISTAEKLKGHLSMAGAYVIFGLNIVVCKDMANSFAVSPIVLFTFRTIGAGVLFWLLSLALPKEKLIRGDWWKIAIASFTGLFIPQMTFLSAIRISTPIDTAVMGTLGPIFTMFFAFFFLKEPITLKKAGGVALSFTGIILLILNSVHSSDVTSTSPLGFAILLLNSLSFSFYLGLFRPLISRYHVVTFMKWMFVFALLFSLPFSAREIFTIDYPSIPVSVRREIGFLIFFATFVAYFLIPAGQKRIRPTIVSMYSYLQPIIASAISIWAGMDIVTWQKILATTLVVGGVILVSRSRAANANNL